MKNCPKCERDKAEGEFGVNRASEDGLTLYCRDCTRAYAKERRIATGKNKPAGWERKTADRAAYRRDYARAHRYDFNAAKARWLKKNPLRQKAKDAVRYAVKVGKLLREPCKVCGAEQVEAHHPDYTKPLDVIWLCRTHHQEHHKDS